VLLRPIYGRRLKNWLCLQLSNVKDEFKSVKRETLGAFWKKTVSAMPLDGLKYSREQQLGTYLNRMYRNIHSWTRFKDDLLCFEEFFKNYFCSEEDNEIRKALSDLDSDTLRRIFLDDDA